MKPPPDAPVRSPPADRPIVSVIIPVHNRGDRLVAALDSVLGQRHRPIEVVVVDDGSTDETAFVAEGWLRRHAAALGADPVLIRQANAGACAARNAGLRASRGAYVQFLDSDDLLLEDKLPSAVAVLEREPDVDLVCGAMEHLDDADGSRRRFRGADLARRPYPAEIALNYSQTMIPVFRASVLRAAGFWDEKLLALQDWEYYARVLVHARRAVEVTDVHCLFRDHCGTRISRSHSPDRQLALERSRLDAIRSVLESVRRTGGSRAAERRLARMYAAAILAVARLGPPGAALAELDADRGLGYGSAAFASAWRGLRMLLLLPEGLSRPALRAAQALRRIRAGRKLLRRHL
jgi:hypothetical protein